MVDAWQWLLTILRAAAPEILTGTLGAFFGAWAAFRLERWQEERSERKQNAQAERKAQFVLNAQYNQIRNLIDQQLTPLRDNDARWRLMPPVVGLPPAQRIEFSSLAFLLESHGQSILSDLLLAEEQFDTLREAQAARTALHLKFQDICSALEQRGLRDTTEEEFEEAVGRATVSQLKTLTNELFHSAERAERANEAAAEKLEKELRVRFRDEVILRRVVLEPGGGR